MHDWIFGEKRVHIIDLYDVYRIIEDVMAHTVTVDRKIDKMDQRKRDKGNRHSREDTFDILLHKF